MGASSFLLQDFRGHWSMIRPSILPGKTKSNRFGSLQAKHGVGAANNGEKMGFLRPSLGKKQQLVHVKGRKPHCPDVPSTFWWMVSLLKINSRSVMSSNRTKIKCLAIAIISQDGYLMTYCRLLKTAKAKKSLPQAVTPQLSLSNYLILYQSLLHCRISLLTYIYNWRATSHIFAK